MSKKEIDAARRLMSLMFKAHPWHGVSMGDHAPDLVTAYIEIVPTDTVKSVSYTHLTLPTSDLV